ncbi:MAG: ATP-binding protein [Pseudomonadota bacterium]
MSGPDVAGTPAGTRCLTADDLDRLLVLRTFWFVSVLTTAILTPLSVAWLIQGGYVSGTAGMAFVALVGWCAWRVRNRRIERADAYLHTLLVTLYGLLVLIAWLQGGLNAPSLRWMAILPLMAIVAGAVRIGMAMSTAFVVQVVVQAFYAPTYLDAVRPWVLPNPAAQTLIATAGSLATFAVFGLVSMRWRRQVLEALDDARGQAHAASETRQRFLATMSHEIRTPLNGILGTASLLKKSMGVAQDQQHLVQLLEDNSHLLLHMLNDVLDWAKLEAGSVAMRQEPVNLQALVRDGVGLFEAQAQGKGLRLTQTQDDPLPEALLGDGMRLRQVINNLLSNAIKFTPQGGVQVHLQCGVPSQPSAPDEVPMVWVRLEVSDTGIGLSAEQCVSLFQPFTQADQGITRQYGGTGLGLSISRELIRGMGGDITVTSQPGQGSSFVVSWPMGEVPPQAEPQTPSVEVTTVADEVASSGQAQALRVLVAEDHELNRLLLEEMLRHCDVQPQFVDNGAAAVEAVGSGAFDVLLMDYQMPEMDGLTAARHIREHEQRRGGPAIYIVLVSGDVHLERSGAWREAGIDALLLKPFVFTDLASLIAERRRAAPAVLK